MNENNQKINQDKLLSFGKLKPFLYGLAYGLLMRLLYFWPLHLLNEKNYNFLDGLMTSSFIFGTPVAIGGITVYFAEQIKRRSFWYYLFAPWASVGLFLLGTMILLIEGSICIAMISPIFLLLGSLGGLIMGISMRIANKPVRSLQGILLIPLIYFPFEINQPLVNEYKHLTSTRFIEAPPEKVWNTINYASNISSAELGETFAHSIGAPRPVSGITQINNEVKSRTVVWEKGIHFNEKIIEWDENKYIKWNYEFAADSFPEGSLDDHVKIGGTYFDLKDTAYTLTPKDGGTLLQIDVNYKFSTAFNWYIDPLSRWLIRDYVESILNFYDARSKNNLISSKEYGALLRE